MVVTCGSNHQAKQELGGGSHTFWVQTHQQMSHGVHLSGTRSASRAVDPQKVHGPWKRKESSGHRKMHGSHSISCIQAGLAEQLFSLFLRRILTIRFPDML